MAEIASAYVSLMASARGFGKQIDSQISGDVNSSGKKAGIGFGKIFAGAAALGVGAAAVGIFKGAIEQASGLEEAGTKINAIFGEKGSAAVQKYADAGAKALGQNRLAVLDSAATFGTMGKAAGLGGTELAKFSTGFATLSTDLASFNNSTPEEATEALGAALRGEAEPIRRFGVLLDDATLRNEALKLGLVKTTKEALTPQQKVLAAQAAIYKQTSDAQGDFQRTSGGLANQQRILSAQWTDMKGVIGSALLPAVTSLFTTMNGRVIPAVTGFIAGIKSGTGAGGQFAAIMGAIASVLGRVTSFVMQNKAAVGTFVGVIGTVIVVTKAWRAAQLALNFILSANPIGLVVVAIAALAAGLVFAYKKSTTFRNIVDGAFSAVKVVAASVASFFTTKVPAAFNVVRNAAASALGWVKSNWPIILAVLTGPFGIAALLIVKNWDRIKAGGVAVLDFIKSMPGKILGFFSNAGTLLLTVGNQIIDGLTAGIRAAAGRVMDAVDAVINAIPAKIRKLMGIASPSKVTTVIGQQIMDGLKMGFDKNGKKVIERMKAHVEKIKSTFDTLKSDMASLSDAVASAFNPDMFGVLGKAADDLGPATTALQEFMSGLSGNNSNLTTMLAAFDQLKAAGASTAFLNGLMRSGNTALATQLATAGPAAIKGASALFDENASLGDKLGNKVAVNEYGVEIRDEMKALNKAMNDAPKKYAKALEPLLENIGRAVGRELNSVAANSGRRNK